MLSKSYHKPEKSQGTNVLFQVKLINRYFKQHHQALLKIYKEMSYFSGDFLFESNTSFTAFMSSIDNNLSAPFS